MKIYEYNERIRSSGYYLKPVHVVYKRVGDTRVKYLYFSRYWYRLVKKDGKLLWIYVGKEKPDPHLPDPPLSPFEGFSVIVDNNDILVDEGTYRALRELSKRYLNIEI